MYLGSDFVICSFRYAMSSMLKFILSVLNRVAAKYVHSKNLFILLSSWYFYYCLTIEWPNNLFSSLIFYLILYHYFKKH
jgi:hypothetical protein